MTFKKITPDFIETLTLEAHPSRAYSSSSSGITGSIFVFADKSSIEKETTTHTFQDQTFVDDSVEGLRSSIIRSTNEGNSNITSLTTSLLAKINSLGKSSRRHRTKEIIRFEPSVQFDSDTLRKNVIRKVLYPFFRPQYPSLNWAYTNYHSLNFFTSSDVPEDSVMIYPAASASVAGTESIFYSPDDKFTFDFYINPRYTTDNSSGEFHAGTIFHMSSSYAVSLVSGSSTNVSGRPDGYRVMLQLSHSAETLPSVVDLSTANNSRVYPNDLIFLSSDNILKQDHWHHVAIRWGGSNVNDGTGSFVIDGVVDSDSTFYIPSLSVFPKVFNDGFADPDALFLGNFYDGENRSDTGNRIMKFFNSTAATQEGVTDPSEGIFSEDPTGFSFSHPLNAEIHDVKLYNSYRTTQQILTSSQEGIEELEDDLVFYVPPFFVKETRVRDVLQTPFFSYRSTTDDPFNVALSFGVGGKLINLENFTREFVECQYPRLYNLTASAISQQTQTAQSANEIMWASGSIRKRNLSLLPCDNGLFIPRFKLLESGTIQNTPASGSLLDKHTNDLGTLNLSLISLTDLVATSSIFSGLTSFNLDDQLEATRIDGEDAPAISLTDDTSTGSITFAIAGASPENPGVAPGSILTVLQRTRDNSSNEVVIFDISNLFYGNKIFPGTFSIVDTSMTGSGEKISITLKDDAQGGLYRADSKTAHAKWNNAGNIIYDEGLVVIKSPHLSFFGKHQFDISFKGEHNLHVLRTNVLCPAGAINSSSNPTWQPLKPSDYANETDDRFVYITGVNLHDENLNVIARANLAQPVTKRSGDKFLFRIEIDF